MKLIPVLQNQKIGISIPVDASMIDSDDDAIPDGVDLCPTAAERYNGYFDKDGCPDNVPVNSLTDTDFDGFIDTLDVCKYD